MLLSLMAHFNAWRPLCTTNSLFMFGIHLCSLTMLLVAVTAAPWSPYALHGTPFEGDVDVSLLSDLGGLRVAFIADLDLRRMAVGMEVLHLVRREKVALTLHAGDADYLHMADLQHGQGHVRPTYPTQFIDTIDRELGFDHRIMVSPGNHDLETTFLQARPEYPDEPTYAQLLQARFERLGLNRSCAGHIGGDLTCSFGSRTRQLPVGPQLLVFASGIAIADEPHRLAMRRAEHEASLATHFARYAKRSPWRICHWHTPSWDLNTGDVPRSLRDDPGEKMSTLCLAQGGIVATGHNHEYARSKALASVERGRVITHFGPPHYYPADPDSFPPRPDLLVLSESSGLVFVQGLGGMDMRGSRNDRDKAAHWARVLINANGGRLFDPRDAGALICEFGGTAASGGRTLTEFSQWHGGLAANVLNRVNDLDAQTAACEFKSTDGLVHDRFNLLTIAVWDGSPVDVVPFNLTPTTQAPNFVQDVAAAPAVHSRVFPSPPDSANTLGPAVDWIFVILFFGILGLCAAYTFARLCGGHKKRRNGAEITGDKLI